MEIKELIERLLKFQYDNMEYGEFTCSSCGSLKYVDYGDHKTPRTERIEECSLNCPWRQAREYINGK